MSTRRVLQRVLLGGWILLGWVSAATADKPLIDRSFHDEGTAPVADCGTFIVDDDYVIDSTVIPFFDGDGNLLRFIEQNYGSDTFSNSVTGKTLRPMHFHNTVLVDRVDHVASTSGIVFRVVVPGGGAAFLDVGRIVTSHGDITFEAGPHEFFDGDLSGLCAALQ